ncbi:MAG: flagellar export chaperone FliS [Homoserinimonas sp.]|jgi:flagellar protein FliS|nr:flagellar export chaperone FliS [Homoserinimonas sp.]
MTMTNFSAQRSQYNRDAILSATPVRLLTMLYDRLLLDLSRAEIAQREQNWVVSSENLLHAQAIIAELMSSLKVELWDGGERLFALYTYINGSLITANIKRETERIGECITLLEPLRQAWHEAGGQLSAQQATGATGRTLGVA